jgi:hypothetical protein
MNSSLQIGNWLVELSNFWVIASAVVLLLALPYTVLTAFRRLYERSPGRAITVSALNVAALIALLLLLIEPAREHLSTQHVVLVSEGAELSNQSRLDADVYVAPAALIEETDRQNMVNANWLLDVGQLVLREPALSSVEVLGYGLSYAQWQGIPADVKIEYEAPFVSGFVAMQWRRLLLMGETLQIQGRFNNSKEGSIIELRLLDPAGKQVTSERILSGGHFDLPVRPKGPGNLEYRLQAWQGDQLLADETVSVFVSVSLPQTILIEQSAPSFETRQLKNHASELGATLLVNSRISKEKFINQAVNSTENTETGFSPVSLAKSDWLIMDGRALTELSAQRTQWLKDAVYEGLGVLIFADESLLNDFERLSTGLLQGFSLSADPNAETETTVQLNNSTAADDELPLPVASMTLKADPSSDSSFEVIAASRPGMPLVAKRRLGLGNVTISLINQSYTWPTAGQRKTWSGYWSTLSSAISRQRQDSFLLAPPDGNFYRMGQRIKVCAFGNEDNLSVQIAPNLTIEKADLAYDLLRLPLIADQQGSARKCGWFWPQAEGWQEIRLLSADTSSVLNELSVYVNSPHEWIGQQRFENVQATLDRQASEPLDLQRETVQKTVREPFEVFWLWLLFIATASLLWLERKLDWDA